jgi:hypothetical protein
MGNIKTKIEKLLYILFSYHKNQVIHLSISMLFITSPALGTPKTVMDWLREQWIHIFYAVIFAIIAGIIIHYVYTRVVPKPKISQKTMLVKPKTVIAKLILPNNNEVKITEDEEVFGREDFVGAVSVDDLLFVGRKHFKITKEDNGVYIEDLNSKNGTKLNGEEIKGLGRRKLMNGDEILVANVLKIRYVEG